MEKLSQKEWITLGVGIGIIIILIIAGKVLFAGPSENATSQAMDQSHNTSQQSQTGSTSAAVQGTNVSSDSKIQIIEVKQGTGAEAVDGKTVSVHYTGTFQNGQKFDSSLDRGKPIDFVLGKGMVIKGWDIGLKGMKVGGKRHLIISPEYGYGPQDYGPIPGNSTLIFDVELVAVK